MTAPAPGSRPVPGGLLIWVTHLYGIGHLRRAVAIAGACRDRGLAVTLVSGGRPVPDLALDGIALVQLPPLASPDASFSRLVDEAGREADAALLAERRRRLLAALEAAAPAVVMTEMYPFGRRSLKAEAEALIAAALARRPRPALLASVRDLLVAKPPEKLRWMLAAAAPYDAVLVHGDPAVLTFDEGFPFAAELGGRLHYTGYVVTAAAEAARRDPAAGRDEVLVSAGGGAFGLALLETALAARPLCPTLGSLPWRLLLGPNLPEPGRRRLLAAGGRGVTVEPARPDFPALLGRCRLSISQAGVNTLLESLAAGARCLVVPYAEAGETEQAARAARFAARGWLSVLEEARLSPGALARAAESAALRPPPRAAINLDGARHSAEIVARRAAIVRAAAGVEEG
ncbi:Predicted glycosyl transferase [Tistlia consotensis]|uniref:Predicted glycosyl transferase n=1 Tax=Tistlia consotensis USBA 355 TaxID=560819 RepID=A0A1Y6BIJ5_9PROT|nr:glycosyltransferase [Tistlia consotensis]SMF09362.1 Predicted glycosyl transferase [Tistlia consotensis USBA 355]SNR34614.1 Predicted glycosyl transferase [Tistlia consotensis]